MKKKYLGFLLAITLGASVAIPANAEVAGWHDNGSSWSYLRSDGTKIRGQWLQDRENWYYFELDGTMKTGWIQDKGNWYYLYSNGAMAHDTTVDGYYLGSSGAWTNASKEWTCPQIKSTATSDVSAGFKILHDELGFGYSSGWAGYSTYSDNPTYVTPTALSVTKMNKSIHNAEIELIIRQWKDDANIKNSYRVQPMAKQLFKFYFQNGSDTLFDDVETIYHGTDAQAYTLLDHVITYGDRQVLFTCPDGNALTMWISAPGESITK